MMFPVLALNLVELLESFKIPNLTDYEFTYYGLPDDPMRHKDPMVFIDMDKALILPGTGCVILCTRKVDREIVTAVRITSVSNGSHVDVERITGSIEIGIFMKAFLNFGYVGIEIAYIDGGTDPLAKSSPAAIWESAHTRQTQLNANVEMEFLVEFTADEPTEESKFFAKQKLNEIRNIEDFGVANPKPC